MEFIFSVFEARKFKIKVLTDIARILFLACKQLPSCGVLIGKKGREGENTQKALLRVF